MAKRIAYVLTALIMAAVVFQGCYTMIKHPRVESADYSAQYYTRQCQDCHANVSEYPYGYSSISYPDYWGEYHRWGDYYAYPWWWQSFWWDIYDDGLLIKGNEDYDPDAHPDYRRGISRNPWDRSFDPAGITKPTRPAGGSGSGGTSTGSGDDGSGNQGDDKKDDDSTKKSEDKKPERRRMPK